MEDRKTISAFNFLEDAGKQMDARAELRDQPDGERTVKTIVETFNALTNHVLTEEDGWTFLLLLKLVRSRTGKFHFDDYTDLCAYSSLLGECKARNEKL
jgi:hypothetical protein